MCADLNRRGFGCRSCTDDFSWHNTYNMGKMFPTSSKDPNEKCLEHPEERYLLPIKILTKMKVWQELDKSDTTGIIQQKIVTEMYAYE